MNEPLISIIIPVFNHASTLERCVDSLVAQTYRPIEIVVVNDGSSDNFDEVMKKIETKVKNSNRSLDLDLRVFSQSNHGASAARNFGFKKSNGQYVMFYDADTIAEPEMLSELKKALDVHTEASYAYSPYKLGWKTMKSQPFNADDLRRYNYIDTMALIRRSSLDDIEGPFDVSLKRFQDWDLWLTLLEREKIGTFVQRVMRTVQTTRVGMSSWLPSFVYKLPWKISRVRTYEAARRVVLTKHRLQ